MAAPLPDSQNTAVATAVTANTALSILPLIFNRLSGGILFSLYAISIPPGYLPFYKLPENSIQII